MKKLMFVAAIVAAMTSLADVTSAGVVGYTTKNIKPFGQLITAQFLGVDKGKEFRLTDLKVDGYQYNTYVLENQGELYSGDLYFYQLDDAGVAQGSVAKYYWYDLNDGGDPELWEGGHWIEAIAARDITKDSPDCIEPGDAVWFYNGLTLDPGEQITITFPSPIADHEEVKE